MRLSTLPAIRISTCGGGRLPSFGSFVLLVVVMVEFVFVGFVDGESAAVVVPYDLTAAPLLFHRIGHATSGASERIRARPSAAI